MNRDNTYLLGNQFAKGHKPNKASFKKNRIPWNKGKKGIHLSPDTEFKKGQAAHNHMEVGSIAKRKQRNGKYRHVIKTAEPNAWREYANYLWKKEYGFVIKGDIVHHLNGDILDDRIENLIALPRADHPVFHSRWGLKELTAEQLAFYRERYHVQQA